MSTLANRRKLIISHLHNSYGILTSDHEYMKGIIADHFKHASSTQDHPIDNNILNCIPPLISLLDNELLYATPSESEIHDVVFNMSSDSAPGPDGFTGAFYQRAWTTIAREVVAAM